MELLSNKFKTAVSRRGLVAVVFCSLFLLFGSVLAVHAQSQSALNSETRKGLQVIEQPLGMSSADIRTVVASIIRTALGFIGIVFFVLFIYAGYLWMTSAGNDEQIKAAKKMLINATIGLGIILLAYTIVSIIMAILGVTGAGGGGDGANGLGNQNFGGSGSLGQVIRDHYPARDQYGVPRNTKIIITFAKPINMRSLAIDTNNSGIFGDCTNIGATMSWQTDCDNVLLDNDHINITRSDTHEPITGAAIVATYENGKVFTVVLRPFDPLGSATDKVAYLVHVGKGILIDDPQNANNSIFGGRPVGSDYYEWSFTADTKMDITPPTVTSVLPDAGASSPKNTVIQVSFSEAVDPSSVQGAFTANGNYFVLSGGNIFLQTGASTVPLGTMRSVNGYRMLEFTPSKECGTNACGGKVYCLPVCDGNGANCQSDSYHILLQAAKTFSLTSFESIPFSGIMDVSGNALDGNANNKIEQVPPSATPFPNLVRPDNYDWQFTVLNKIDLTPPYITSVTPGLDAPFIKATDTLAIGFSKAMQYGPLYSLRIEEKPASNVPLCLVPRLTNVGGVSSVELLHCPFLDAAKHYYYPVIDSQVQDVNFNCLFPGKGPIGLDNITKQSLVCDAAHPQNCCPVDSVYGGKATCCNGVPVKDDSGASCMNNLKASSL